MERDKKPQLGPLQLLVLVALTAGVFYGLYHVVIWIMTNAFRQNGLIP